MRKSKLAAQQRERQKVKQHTPPERLALRKLKRKNGPSGKRRAERRAADASIAAKRKMHDDIRKDALRTLDEEQARRITKGVDNLVGMLDEKLRVIADGDPMPEGLRMAAEAEVE